MDRLMHPFKKTKLTPVISTNKVGAYLSVSISIFSDVITDDIFTIVATATTKDK